MKTTTEYNHDLLFLTSEFGRKIILNKYAKHGLLGFGCDHI